MESNIVRFDGDSDRNFPTMSHLIDVSNVYDDSVSNPRDSVQEMKQRRATLVNCDDSRYTLTSTMIFMDNEDSGVILGGAIFPVLQTLVHT